MPSDCVLYFGNGHNVALRLSAPVSTDMWKRVIAEDMRLRAQVEWERLRDLDVESSAAPETSDLIPLPRIECIVPIGKPQSCLAASCNLRLSTSSMGSHCTLGFVAISVASVNSPKIPFASWLTVRQMCVFTISCDFGRIGWTAPKG